MSKENTKEAHDRRAEGEQDFYTRKPKMPAGIVIFPAVVEHHEKDAALEAARNKVRASLLAYPSRIKYRRDLSLGKQVVK